MRVYGELPADADGVDAPVIDPGTLPPGGVVRRWGWAVLAIMAVAALTVTRLGPGRGWVIPDAVAAFGMAALAVAAIGMLVRYADDQHTARSRADRGALAQEADAMVGTVVDRPSGSRHKAVVVGFGAQEESRVRWSLPPQAGPALPRVGDPVAVWVARDREAVLLRYERQWAQDLLDALDGGSATPGPE